MRHAEDALGLRPTETVPEEQPTAPAPTAAREDQTDLLLRRVLYGISCRNYEAAAEVIPGAIGLSGSTVSRAFIEASAAKLRELHHGDDTHPGRIDDRLQRRR